MELSHKGGCPRSRGMTLLEYRICETMHVGVRKNPVVVILTIIARSHRYPFRGIRIMPHYKMKIRRYDLTKELNTHYAIMGSEKASPRQAPLHK